MKNNINGIVKMYEQSFNEMYVLNTMINLMKQSCEDREYKAIYYGLNSEGIKKISSERNDYINILSVVSDKISNIMSLFISMENEFSLNQNSDNCCR